MNKEELINQIREITTWTCLCNSVTFDDGKCRLCGGYPSYGSVDYDALIELLNNAFSKEGEE